MDSEKLNKLCEEARIQSFTVSDTFVDSDTDKEKLQKLKIVVRCINNLEKIKEQIENEINITKEDTIKELECVRDYNFDTANCIGESLRRAILGKSNAETIKYINDAIYGLCHLERHKIRLETLREKLNLEEKENDNQ